MNLFQFKMRSTFKTWILNFSSRLITYHSSSWLRHVQKRLLLESTGNSEKYMVKQRLLAWIKMTFKFFLILFIYFLAILPSKHPSSSTSIYSPNILENPTEAVKTENKDCWCFAVLCLFVWWLRVSHFGRRTSRFWRWKLRQTLILYVHVFKALFIWVQMNVWPIVDFVVWGILLGPFSEEWYR